MKNPDGYYAEIWYDQMWKYRIRHKDEVLPSVAVHSFIFHWTCKRLARNHLKRLHKDALKAYLHGTEVIGWPESR